MKRSSLIVYLIFPVMLLAAVTSCQRVFTYSPLSFMQRDPSTLPADQQVSYAENMLASGSAEDMAAAYALIQALLAQDSTNPDLQILAAELAIGGSGLGGLLSSLDTSAGLDTLNASLETLNLDLAGDVSGHVDAAVANGGTVSESLYVNASMAILANEANDAGGFDQINWDAPSAEVQKALDYAALGGVDMESLFGGGGA